MLKRYFIVILVLFALIANSQSIKIGLYYPFEVKTLVFKTIKGSFTYKDDNGQVENISKNDILYFTLISDDISVWGIEKHMGMSKNISITPNDDDCLFMLEPAFPVLPKREYEGSLNISIFQSKKINIINSVELEKYVASVVEAESGTRAFDEYYKSQAVICRTYALNHLDRHLEDGYNLCDNVHCQVYMGIKTSNKKIRKAVFNTKGIVLTDSSMNLVTAAFHSNSGGYTINSEDVWSSAMPYLRGKKDIYWKNHHNSTWVDTIKTNDYIKFLKHVGVTVPSDVNYNKFRFEQIRRTPNLSIMGQLVPLKYIREQFKLRSTFFSIYPKGDVLILKGRGYGHGVGLSQESAMEMAKEGKKFDEIINYYYSNVKFINVDSTTFLQRLLNNN